MKISVIIPVYNVEQYLDQAICSVINQTYKNLEIIIVNDASPDNSDKIIKKYAIQDSRIIVLNNPKNIGLGPSRDRAIQTATGDYLMFLDSDDFYESDLCEQVAQIASSHNPDIISFRFQRYFNNGHVEQCPWLPLLPTQKTNIFEYDFCLSTSVWSRAWNREFVMQHKLKNGIQPIEDIPFSFSAFLLANNIWNLDIVGYNYRLNQSSLSQKPFDTNKKIHANDIAFKFIDKFTHNKFPKYASLIKLRVFSWDMAKYNNNMPIQLLRFWKKQAKQINLSDADFDLLPNMKGCKSIYRKLRKRPILIWKLKALKHKK